METHFSHFEQILSSLRAEDFDIRSLGPRTRPSPLESFFVQCGNPEVFYTDDNRVLIDHSLEGVYSRIQEGQSLPCLEVAGPRRKTFFDPRQTRCAIVTCGGLCPGLNDVIRSIFFEAHYRYGIEYIYGIPYGFEGLNPEYGHEILQLTPKIVSSIHRFGGTRLGTSRGPQPILRMVDCLEGLGIQILFVIGGDGSQRGACAIEQEAANRGLALAVVGVPKTIDNDMIFMDKSFGYETAVSAAVEAIHAAHTEAVSARNGVGLVKLMGRHSGFIACSAAISSGEVNGVLIPEIPFSLDGENGFLEYLYQRVCTRGHAVIIVAEGAGQELLGVSEEYDLSGNVRLKDIGLFLKQKIQDHFHIRNTEINLKYIDPSYLIRSVPASSQDRIYCMRLAQAAVHAGMAGKTGLVVARWHSCYVHLPMKIAISKRRNVDPEGDLWLSVLESTGQPAQLGTL